MRYHVPLEVTIRLERFFTNITFERTFTSVPSHVDLIVCSVLGNGSTDGTLELVWAWFSIVDVCDVFSLQDKTELTT
jgi:hypothetical protein